MASLLSHISMLLISMPGQLLINGMACFTGLVVCAYYSMIQCDPMASGRIANGNQILPHFVTTIFAHAPGFTGLFLATLYGGTLRLDTAHHLFCLEVYNIVGIGCCIVVCVV